MKKFLTLAVLTLGLTLTGCGNSNDATDDSTKEATSPKTTFKGEYTVDADYVKDNLDDIILIDARGDDAAKKETVKKAVPMAWQYLADVESGATGDENWGLVLEPKKLAERLGEKGIDKDKEVVLFASAQEGWGDDGRIAWELLAAGYKDVKMVKGGTELKPVDVKIDSLNQDHMIKTDELKADYDDYKIVDVRANEEYDGEVLYGEAKGGHLPGAIQVRYTDMFNKNGTLKSNEKLTKIFEDAGLSKDDKIVTYCTAGIRSAYTQLVMDMCGFKNVKNYDGSFYRWAKVEDVEK
jgi:thiosulfate/3-mercaptopyruvate sulfurtransferase